MGYISVMVHAMPVACLICINRNRYGVYYRYGSLSCYCNSKRLRLHLKLLLFREFKRVTNINIKSPAAMPLFYSVLIAL